MENLTINLKNDLYIKNNLYVKLNIYEYIKDMNLKNFHSNIFENLWFALNTHNLIVINKELINFIFKNNENKIYCLYKIIKKNYNYICYTKNDTEIFKTYEHLNDLIEDCCYLISFKNIKKYLYLKNNIEFEKINYIVSVEKLFKDYNLYLNTNILLNNEKIFFEKQNIIKTDFKVFYILWKCIKNNYDVIISSNILKFIDYDKPCVQHNFKKNYNERVLIDFLKKKNIPFEEIQYKDERCLTNIEVYTYLIRFSKNKKLKKKKWILLTLNNFRFLLTVLNTRKREEIIFYFNNVSFLYNIFYKKKNKKNNLLKQDLENIV